MSADGCIIDDYSLQDKPEKELSDVNPASDELIKN
jgi:hypothetical protein